MGKREIRALKKLELSDPLRIGLDIFLAQLEELWVHQVSLRAALRKLCKKERYHKAFTIARSLPGIGWFTAIRFILELGEDLSRFTSGKKIASFVGLTCSEDSTGERIQKGRITGMGPGFIRATLIENSWTAIRKDPVLLAKFARVWHASGSRKKAIVAVARMLIVRYRACMLADTPYVICVAAYYIWRYITLQYVIYLLLRARSRRVVAVSRGDKVLKSPCETTVYNVFLPVAQAPDFSVFDTGSFFPQVDTCGQTTNRRL